MSSYISCLSTFYDQHIRVSSIPKNPYGFLKSVTFRTVVMNFFPCMLNVGVLIGKCVDLIKLCPLLHIVIDSTSQALLQSPFFFFRRSHRSVEISFNLHLSAPPVTDIKRLPLHSLPPSGLLLPLPNFSRPSFLPSVTMLWLTLHQTCGSAEPWPVLWHGGSHCFYEPLFACPRHTRHNRCHSCCMYAGSILVHDFEQHLCVNVGWHECSHICCAFIEKIKIKM